MKTLTRHCRTFSPVADDVVQHLASVQLIANGGRDFTIYSILNICLLEANHPEAWLRVDPLQTSRGTS
jgi:hypothetical protein